MPRKREQLGKQAATAFGDAKQFIEALRRFTASARSCEVMSKDAFASANQYSANNRPSTSFATSSGATLPFAHASSSNTASAQLQQNRLGAPIACFDDGFSSDGAFFSGAETDKDATPTDHESDNNNYNNSADRTPKFELPRLRGNAAMTESNNTPMAKTVQDGGLFQAAISKGNNNDAIISGEGPKFDSGQDHLLTYSHSEEDVLTTSIPVPSLPATQPQPHLAAKIDADGGAEEELMGANLLAEDESDTEDPFIVPSSAYTAGGYAQNSSALSGSYGYSSVSAKQEPNAAAIPSGLSSSLYYPPYDAGTNNPMSMSAADASYSTAYYSPRPTQVSIDQTAGRVSEQQREYQQMRREYKTQAVTRPRSTTPVRHSVLEAFVAQTHPTSPTPSEAKMQIVIPGAETRQSRSRTPRHSSKTWEEFNQNMAAQIPGRVSGRTTPTAAEPMDIFDSYQRKVPVPPSPVVHRRSSREWTLFDDEDTRAQTIALLDQTNRPISRSQSGSRSALASSNLPCMRPDSSSSALRQYGDLPHQVQKPAAPPRPPPRPGSSAEVAKPVSEGGTVAHSWSAESQQQQMQEQQLQYERQQLLLQQQLQQQYRQQQDQLRLQQQREQEQQRQQQQMLNQQRQQQMLLQQQQLVQQQQQQLAAQQQAQQAAAAPASEQRPQSRPPPPRPAPISPQPQRLPPSVSAAAERESAQAEELRQPPKSPVPARPPPATKAKPAAEEKKMSSSDWEEFQRITQRVTDMVKQTQEKLQEMEQTTAVKSLKTSKYENYTDEKASVAMPANLMDMNIEEHQKPPVTESEKKDPKEWRSINDVLAEEINRQRELNKPKRPPAPPRPPPRPAPAPRPDVTASSWDEEPGRDLRTREVLKVGSYWSGPADGSSASEVSAAMDQTASTHRPAQPATSKTSVPALPDWDDEAAVAAYYASVPSYTPKLAEAEASYQYPAIGSEGDESAPNVPSAMESEANFTNNNYDGSNIKSNNFPDQNGHQTVTEPVTDELENFLSAPIEPAQNGNAEETLATQLQPTTNGIDPAVSQKWTFNLENAKLASSGSDFFARLRRDSLKQTPTAADAFVPQKPVDIFAPLDESLLAKKEYDPFEIKPVEDIVAEAKAKAQAQLAAEEVKDDMDFFGVVPKPEEVAASSPESLNRPMGFEDEFRPANGRDESPSPLFDEDDSLPLPEFPAKFTGDGWEMMIRYPIKKKIMGDRYWKPVYVRIKENAVLLYHSQNDKNSFQEVPLQANYCLSDITLQQYDIYGKIHTVKLQYVVYKEQVGIRPGQLPKLVQGHFTKLGLPLEHSAQSTPLVKFGSLNNNDLQTFVRAVEDILFKISSAREGSQEYKQDEIQVHVYDEYSAYIDKNGTTSDQRCRVRLFCLAFVSGMPLIEIGLNDRRRQGKEIVRRKDIMPMDTERWIRMEALDWHCLVDRDTFQREHSIRLQPLDATFFEVLRFRVRPPKGKENPLIVRPIMKIAGSKIEIRIECMATAFKSRKAGQVPCEDIQIRFPVPEAWIYLFREERHWGYGSVHAQKKRPGKVKNFTDRLMGVVKSEEASLIEVAIGDAKYEHVYRALVWRIARLPEKHHGAYKTHLLRCRFQLSSFDLMPETFVPNCDVEFTMPRASVSHTVVRSVSIEQHEDPDVVEKWVRYCAKYQHRVEIDYMQTAELDMEGILDITNLEPEKSLEKPAEMHKPDLDINAVKELHEGYRIDFSEAEMGGRRYDDNDKQSSSESEDEGSRKPKPKIQIDIKAFERNCFSTAPNLPAPPVEHVGYNQ